MDFMPRYMAKNPRYIDGQDSLEMLTAPAIFLRMRGCLSPFLGLSSSGLFLAEEQKIHGKGTYLATLFRRLAARRGKHRAIIAVAHSILVSVFSILVRHEPYRELGATHFDRSRYSQSVERLTRRLEQ